MKINKGFYITNDDLEDINRGLIGDINLFHSSSDTHRNKITITYEIDREVTIKESDLEKLLEPSTGFTRGDVNCLKEIFFGGGENE